MHCYRRGVDQTAQRNQPMMAINVTDSTQPDSSYLCSLSGDFAWKAEYLSPSNFAFIVLAASLEALICPFTIFLNAFVILAVKRKRYLRKKKHCVFLACLAATDLFVGVVVLPLVITNHVQYILGVDPICLIYIISSEVTYLACGASLCHLVIISAERFISIKHALRYETLVTTRRLTIAVAVAWSFTAIISTLVNIAFILSGEAVPSDESDSIAILLTVLGSLLLISFCQVALLLESRRHRKHIKAHQVSAFGAKEFLKEDKAARTTTIIISFLLFCFFPVIIFQLVALPVNNVPIGSLIGPLYLVEMGVYLNSLLNPIIYCIRTQEFQRALKELFNLEDSQLTVVVRAKKTSQSRKQQDNDNKARADSSKKMAWPAPPRGTRSCSLNFTSKVASPESRRTNSM